MSNILASGIFRVTDERIPPYSSKARRDTTFTVQVDLVSRVHQLLDDSGKTYTETRNTLELDKQLLHPNRIEIIQNELLCRTDLASYRQKRTDDIKLAISNHTRLVLAGNIYLYELTEVQQKGQRFKVR